MSKPRVLIVDDSIVYRTQIRKLLESSGDFEVAGVAANGKIGLEKLLQLAVDIVILDLEMPEINGLGVLRMLKSRGVKTKVVVFSSHSTAGAKITLEALALGAYDFVTKPVSADVSEDSTAAIASKILPLLRRVSTQLTSKIQQKQSEVVVKASQAHPLKNRSCIQPKALVIGASTGGPAALENLFKKLRGIHPQIPVFLVQHMPPLFTASLAERLSQVSGLDVREARDQEVITPGRVYVAPGDFHMRIEGRPPRLSLHQGAPRQSMRPACDELFESAARVYRAGCVGLVLTGMGEDGKQGAQVIREQGGFIFIQNKESCAVFGMPGAIFECGAYDCMESLDELGNRIARLLEQKEFSHAS